MSTIKTLTIGMLVGISVMLVGWFAAQKIGAGNENLEGHSAIEQQVNDGGFEEKVTTAKPVMPSPDFHQLESTLEPPMSDLLVEWPRSMPPDEFMNAMEGLDGVTDKDINHYMYSWLSTCKEVGMFALQVEGFSAYRERSPKFGSKGDVAQALSVLCRGILPESIDVRLMEDGAAIDSIMLELAEEIPYAEARQTLLDSFEQGGKGMLADTAADILMHAVDAWSISLAIDSLVYREIITSPLLSDIHDMAGWGFHHVSRDVATVLLCDRIGGCRGSDHPIVLQRCFEGVLGCNRPADIHDAIYQLTPPLEYEVFWVLLSETRRFMRLYRQ